LKLLEKIPRRPIDKPHTLSRLVVEAGSNVLHGKLQISRSRHSYLLSCTQTGEKKNKERKIANESHNSPSAVSGRC